MTKGIEDSKEIPIVSSSIQTRKEGLSYSIASLIVGIALLLSLATSVILRWILP